MSKKTFFFGTLLQVYFFFGYRALFLRYRVLLEGFSKVLLEGFSKNCSVGRIQDFFVLGCNNGGGGGNFSKVKQLVAKCIGTQKRL